MKGGDGGSTPTAWHSFASGRLSRGNSKEEAEASAGSGAGSRGASHKAYSSTTPTNSVHPGGGGGGRGVGVGAGAGGVAGHDMFKTSFRSVGAVWKRKRALSEASPVDYSAFSPQDQLVLAAGNNAVRCSVVCARVPWADHIA